MKNIIITDNCNPKFAYNLSKQYNLGSEVQSFHDPYILETNPNLKTLIILNQFMLHFGN
ncbi:hypothetical protein QJS64_12780 [Paraclostridium bifermentans]|uniref:Uncharacterized protein n=1 Tax=Paraclostridium bifermentans TaxID=1490 RepID=A0ABY8R1T9_PARBF|nr:hypothetical protein QJS64_12780 [Paraclostridium bifermentans]